jgi:NAD(P)-dependent dehydrogenase (short-subunit alcohol dehydrogenase family)
MTGRLDGMTAIVTGAGSGIVHAIALRFAGEGAMVLAVARSDSAAATAEAARASGGAARPARCDVGDEADVLELYERFDAELGTAEEIAEAALYLASPQAGLTTGADLVVDGGATAR